jgi:hypothetical protein
MMPPEEKPGDWGLWFGWSLLILLALVVLYTKMATTQSEALITVKDIVVWFVGILSAIVIYAIWHFIQNRLSRYPQRLFKTQFYPTIPYPSQEFGKPLILHVGQTSKQFLWVSTKKTCEDISRIGIRPQIKRRWYKHWFRYNYKTENIAFNNRNNPPIRIKSIKDVSLIVEEDFDCDVDDNTCGRFGFYKFEAPLKMIPGQQVVYEIEIEALKLWSGFIDFRIDTKDGMRVSHHPCEIR